MKITIKDLFYLYQNGNETVVALRGLHLDIASGECLVVKGPNGSGKSTLVKILSGFLTPSSGKIHVGDQDLTEIDPLTLRRKYVASIDQRGNLLSGMSVLENVALAISLTGVTPSQSKKQALALLERHGLSEVSPRYPEQLSAGERQICSLLAAIATEPTILIADEPSGELDNEAADALYRILKSESGERTIILVTHDTRAENIADRVIRMREGRVSEEWIPGFDEKSVVDPMKWMRLPEPKEKKSQSQKPTIDLSMRHGPFLLQAENISLTYGEESIFTKINVDGKAGEIIALFATSGAGKSSLLRILAGIQNPTTGSVHIGSVLLSELNRESGATLRRKMVSFLPQGEGGFHNISLSDHLGDLGVSLNQQFEMRLQSPLSRFSGGERARLELLKLLAQQRPILILDEPTSQLDDKRSAELIGLIIESAKNGTLVIASTREETLLGLANRVITLG